MPESLKQYFFTITSKTLAPNLHHEQWGITQHLTK